jgi:hypothetical protein
MKPISLLIVISILLMPQYAALAVSDAVIVGSTQPISTELTSSAEAWLQSNQPAQTSYYAVTYIQSGADGTYLCLAGLNIESAGSDWNIEDNGIWFGTIMILPGGDVRVISMGPSRNGGNKLASQKRAGGGTYLRFPWEGGKAMVYGKRGVHGSGDFGTSGMLAVDFVGGDALGSNIASNTVYAVDDGVIDYVCDDDVTFAVRTHNNTTGDYFLYAHLLENSNLVISHAFSQGENIGKLKYGTFTSNGCGYAQQQSSNYHLHFMFTPNSGAFAMEDCVLSTTDQKWTCGGKTIETGSALYSTGNSTSVGEDMYSNSAQYDASSLSFFDMIVMGALLSSAASTVELFPAPSAESSFWTFRDNVINTILVIFKIIKVLAISNINFGLPMAVLTFFVMINILLFGLRAFTRAVSLVSKLIKFL